MACGTPVVALDRGSLKDVVGDAGLIASYPEAGEIAKLFTKIATDSCLRAELSRRATKRVKIFSWKKFAGEVFQHINTLAHEYTKECFCT